MGKGDQRTGKGKMIRGTTGKTRPKHKGRSKKRISLIKRRNADRVAAQSKS